MQELLKQFAVYNSWANKKLMDTILDMPADKHVEEVPSSFNSLYKTTLHMWDAESIWWQRMKLQEGIVAPSVHFKGTTRDVITALLHQNKLWENWIAGASPAALEHVFMYYNAKSEGYKMPIHQMLVHVFNHGTYHRGQLVNMLRQLGVQKIPQTDFAVWTRIKK